MKYLIWAVGISCVMVFVSLFAEASDRSHAWVAPKTTLRIPASNEQKTEDGKVELSQDLEGASIEVGFSQDGEPEPHLFAVVNSGEVKVFELLNGVHQPAGDAPAKTMLPEVFAKRIKQAVDSEHFFSSKQVRRKTRCKDHYVLRIKIGNKFRERRGCSHQSNDRFAALSQNIYRDAYLARTRK